MEFRVYDKKRKKFLEEDVYLNQNGDLFKPNKSLFGKPTFLYQDRYVYQKYIELSDRDGKPIFVGDYLEAIVENDEVVTGVVIFAKELSSYVILCNKIDKYFVLGESVTDCIKIIGNVFDGLDEEK